MTCDKVQFSLMNLVFRKIPLFKEKRERHSQNGDLVSPVLCLPAAALWVPWVTFRSEAHEGWRLPAPGIFGGEARGEG